MRECSCAAARRIGFESSAASSSERQEFGYPERHREVAVDFVQLQAGRKRDFGVEFAVCKMCVRVLAAIISARRPQAAAYKTTFVATTCWPCTSLSISRTV